MSPTNPVPPRLAVVPGIPGPQVPVTGPLQADMMHAPSPPAWLPREAKAEWRRVVAAVAPWPAWLQVVDRAALTGYCAAWATFVEAAKDVAKRGVLVPGRSPADKARDGDGGALVKNPALQIQRDASVQMRSWARELGFTPDARGRVDVGVVETPNAEGPWD